MPIQYDVCYDSEATEKKQCTLASSGYYLAGDVATVCATVADSSARTCNAAAAAGIQAVTCNTGFVSFCCCCYFLHFKIYFYCKRILF